VDQLKQTVKRPGSGKAGIGRESAGGSGLLNRSMPESVAAEAAVLGSMLIDPECIGLVVEKIKAEAFYRIENQIIFDALIALYEKNKGIGLDAVLLRDELERNKQLDEIGGVDYIGRAIEPVPSSANALYYILMMHMMLAVRLARSLTQQSRKYLQ